MVVLCGADLVRKRYGDIHLALVLGLVVAVAGLYLGFPVLDGGESAFADKLRYVVYNAVCIIEGRGLKGSAHLIAENELNAGVYYRLTLHYVEKIFGLDIDVGEHLEIRLPCDFGACVAL